MLRFHRSLGIRKNEEIERFKDILLEERNLIHILKQRIRLIAEE